MTENLEQKCDFSELQVPTDEKYKGIAIGYVDLVAGQLGFDELEREEIKRSVGEAVANVMEHAFEPSEKASFRIACERVPLGLKVTITDTGMPFDADQVKKECFSVNIHDNAPQGCGISAMKEHMDEVYFNNLGIHGKETVLVKYFKNRTISDYYAACDLVPYSRSLPRPAGTDRKDIMVRPMRSSEAVEVSRCVYRAYGYSYSNDTAYYPDRLIKLNESGQISSVVAVTKSGEVVGHCALLRFTHAPRIAEMGMGFVKPDYRSLGIFSKLGEFLLARAKSENLIGVFGRAVSNHTFSQRIAHKLGLKDCAILVGHLPQTTSFKGITENLAQRETLVVHFMYVHDQPTVMNYPPFHHFDIIHKLYANLHAQVVLTKSDDVGSQELPDHTVITTRILGAMGVARIDVEHFGKDVITQVKTRLRELCLQRLDTINLYLNLEDPWTPVFDPGIEELGFFLAGILPGERTGDALILQYLNNVPIDYSRIRVASQEAQDLLAYVQKNDPNNIF